MPKKKEICKKIAVLFYKYMLTTGISYGGFRRI